MIYRLGNHGEVGGAVEAYEKLPRGRTASGNVYRVLASFDAAPRSESESIYGIEIQARIVYRRRTLFAILRDRLTGGAALKSQHNQ